MESKSILLSTLVAVSRAKTAGFGVPSSALTLNATKQALARLQRRLSRDEGEDLILMCYMSRDFREGLDAFLNKRPPQWKAE